MLPIRSLKLPKGGLIRFSLRPSLPKIRLTPSQIQALMTVSSLEFKQGYRKTWKTMRSSSMMMTTTEHPPSQQFPWPATDVQCHQAKKTIENLTADQEIVMISQWSDPLEQEVEVSPYQGVKVSQSRPPLRVSNSNTSQVSHPRTLSDRKRVYSVLTAAPGQLLIRAGVRARSTQALDENMVPPAKKKCCPPAVTGNLPESGNGQRRDKTTVISAPAPGPEKYQLRRLKVLH